MPPLRLIPLEVPALDRRERNRSFHRPFLGHDAMARALDGTREPLAGPVLEELPRRQLQAQLPRSPRDLRRDDRVSAERKEVIVATDPIDAKDRLPDLRESLLDLGARRLVVELLV